MSPDLFQQALQKLRTNAETYLTQSPASETILQTAEEVLHELHVHQIELEMQNEELRQAQIALEESRDNYLNLYELSLVSYLTLSEDGRITELNLTCADLLGTVRSKLLGRRFVNLISPDDADRWHRHYARVRQSGEKLSCELRMRRMDGGFWHARIDCLHMAEHPTHVVRMTILDISMAKQAQLALMESNRLLSLSMQLGHMGSWDLNLVDHNSIRSPEHDRIFGYPEPLPEWRYETFLEHVVPEERGEVDRKFQQAVADGTEWNIECGIRRSDGALRWIHIAGGQQRGDNGDLQHMYGVVQDITDRKLMEHALLEQNKALQLATDVAEQASQAKSVFLSRMSHELRTPLHAILGFSQLLEVAKPPPTPVQIVRLQQISRAGWYLLELINDILDLAVIESGNLALSLTPLRLCDLLLECRGIIETQAQACSIHLNFDACDHDWFVYADRTRIQQALINLLTNAVKYNRPQGTVEVNCSAPTPERIRISVKDSGVGISEENMAHLFEPFNRLGQENTSTKGTGIGLVITRQLVELMGGTLGVASEIGVGSEFWIELDRDVTSPPA